MTRAPSLTAGAYGFARRDAHATAAPMQAGHAVRYLPHIDGLRAISVLFVIAFHLFPETLTGGFVGVDVFFVISGYLISGIILSAVEAGTFSFADFYARRIRRIFPALATVLAAVLIGGVLWLPPAQLETLGKHVAAGAGFASNLVYMRESGYFDDAAQSKHLLNLWSLGVEEQFYVVWPPIIWLVYRFRLNILNVLLVVSMASFAVGVWALAGNDGALAFYSPLARFWELLVGGMLACLALPHCRDLLAANSSLWAAGMRLKSACQSRLPSRTPGDLASVAGLGLIVLSAWFIDQKTWPFPGPAALLPTFGALFVLSAGPNAFVNRVFLASRPMVAIGLVSYPLYLWHWPLLTFARTFADAELPTAALTGVFVASLALAAATYVLIEKPIRFSRRGGPAVAALCAVLIALAAAGVAIYRADGFNARFPAAVQALRQGDDNHVREWRSSECFLDQTAAPSAFGAACLDRGPGPSVFLWGDSHAAAAYPGLASLQSRRPFALSQFTASLCAPLIGRKLLARPLCSDVNDFVLETIAAARPDVVILESSWSPAYDLSKLPATVGALRAIGTKTIILIGPVPNWKDRLADDMFFYWKRTGELPPDRMKFRLVDGWAGVDAIMRNKAKAAGIVYVSAYDALCNREGCLTRPDPAGTDLMVFDEAHFTPAGARHFARLIESQLFAAIFKTP